MRFRHIAALVAVALLVALPVAAQETTGAITGAVRGQDGALLPGATIVVTGPIGTVQAVSDERGEFRFPRLPSHTGDPVAAFFNGQSGHPPAG